MEKTGAKKITYIGHSQGTSQMFSALCEQPEFFKDKMKMYVALAPVVSLKNVGSDILKDLAKQEKVFNSLKMIGPDLFSSATADNFMLNFMAASALGNMTSG